MVEGGKRFDFVLERKLILPELRERIKKKYNVA
jgi:hypothetical protein